MYVSLEKIAMASPSQKINTKQCVFSIFFSFSLFSPWKSQWLMLQQHLPLPCYLLEQLMARLSSDYDLGTFEMYLNYSVLFVQRKLASGGKTS